MFFNLKISFKIQLYILSFKLPNSHSFFVWSSGLLLQESNKFSEALHYYKLAIGSRPTLACKYSSSFFIDSVQLLWLRLCCVQATVNKSCGYVKGKKRITKGSGCTAELNIQAQLWAPFKAQLCQQIEQIHDVIYWEFRQQCFHSLYFFFVLPYSICFFKLLSIFSSHFLLNTISPVKNLQSVLFQSRVHTNRSCSHLITQ